MFIAVYFVAVCVFQASSSSSFLIESYFKENDSEINDLKRCESCKNGWQLKFGSCYKSSERPMTFMEAKEFCSSFNSSLAQPNTSQESFYLNETLAKYSSTFANLVNAHPYVWVHFRSGFLFCFKSNIYII